ncbi:serine/threonine-protein kinase-like protein CCR4 [Rutidosis leptorrhynchoides]|uniref:serine/threonine-protein kinase-like protein CCR4 n=1 Tax=Rutidosis leptorrhynchoides TaxID=125765 RepID=UPI003A99DB8D
MTHSLIFLLFFLLIIPSSISTLSTVSITHITSSNQTLICALTNSQTNNLNCTTPFDQSLPSTRFPYVGIVGGTNFLCALSSPFNSSSKTFLVCWRFLANGSPVYKRIYLGSPLKDIDSDDQRVCGIVTVTNQLLCWQWDEFNHNSILNQSQFNSSVAIGQNFVCGLSEFGRIKCNNFNIMNGSQNGNYSVVSAGYNRVCAINANGGLECWGDVMTSKPSGVFKSVAIGDNRYCVIRINGTVFCWGESGFGLPRNLEQVYFEGLQVNRDVFCGITTSNYSIYCWGNEFFNSNSSVFANVVPGLCTTSCECGTIVNYATFCDGDLMICRPCVYTQAPPELVPPPPSPATRNGGWSGKMVAFAVVGSVGCLSFVFIFVYLFLRFCKSVEGSRVHDSGPMESIQFASGIRASNRILVKKLSHLISMGTGNHLEEFDLQTIIDATDNFSDERRIGVGSFGSVYHGLLTNGRKVAIKRAEITSSPSGRAGTNKRQEDTNNAFLSELEFLSRVNHKNLVQLLGYCEENNELVLVYEFMENGSLHDHLHNVFSSHIMSWPARIKVALDAARGLEYLHVYADPPIIHRDIKSSNILLDGEWTGKVSDFGLSLLGPPDNGSHLSLGAAGTVGYMDPEYYKYGQLTAKSDVYSFGVMLLELLSGHRAIQKNETGERRNVVDSVVPYIENDVIYRILDRKVPPPTAFEIEAVKNVGYLAADCVTLLGKDRPTMSELVICLERALSDCLTIPSFGHSSNGSSS